MSAPITSHFDLSEFASHDGRPYPVGTIEGGGIGDDGTATWLQTRLLPLCQVLEAVRAALGGHAVTILSGYRSPEHNAAVGGAQASQHMEGRAADITVEGYAPSDVHKCILQLFNDGTIQIGGLGVYPGWVHVDVRPWIGHLAMWTGAKVGDEQAV